MRLEMGRRVLVELLRLFITPPSIPVYDVGNQEGNNSRPVCPVQTSR